MNKKCDCENIRERFLLAILEQDTEILASLDNEEMCVDCKRFITDMVTLNETIKDIASISNNVLPKIDITNEILRKLRILQEKEIYIGEILEREIDNPEEAEWIAFIEDDLDEVTKFRCLSKLKSSSFLQKEIEDLKQIHNELEKLGEIFFCPDLDENLLPKIMTKLSSCVGVKFYSGLTENEALVQLERDLIEISESAYVPTLHINSESKKPENVVQQNRKPVSYRNFIKRTEKEFSKTDRKVVSFTTRGLLQIFAIAASILLVLLGVYRFLLNDTNQITNASINVASNKPSPFVQDTDKFKVILPPNYSNILERQTSENNQDSNSELSKKYTPKPLSEWGDILKENALVNAGKLMRMGIWASLTPEEARELLKKSSLSPMAILGAVQFLPPEEAKVILEAAIANNPEDAYLRFAMVNTLRNLDNIDYDELREHISAWTSSDPSNILPYYMEASIYLKNGEVDGALTCIKEADKVQGYNSYTILTAQAYKEALIAKGVDPQLASLLASASLGARETQTLDEIARTLLDYGKYYEDIGDYNTALMIYEALRNLGVNVDMSSNLLQEKLAGVRYAQEAIYALIRIMTQTYSFTDIQSYILFLQDLNQLLTNYNNALANFYKIFDKADSELLIQILNTYLTTGNVTITQPPQINQPSQANTSAGK